MKKYCVNVYFYVTGRESVVVDVTADSEEEAQDKALEMACTGKIPASEWETDYDSFEGDGEFHAECLGETDE